ncbi:MAG: polyketide synthase dehydratase domain-containing protein, partial [Verrucomicrobiales bacterium]
AQHQVDGEHILPGVSLIALALEAAVPLSESASVVVENVTWMAPCKVSRTGTSVRIEITALEGNRYQADICDDATTFAQMTLSADLGGECSVEFSSRLELDGAVVMTADALYCRLRQQKIEHGSLYQRVETIHLLRDRAEGRIDASAEAPGCGQFPFTVLDAALQVPAALEAPNGSPVLPHSIAQLVWRGASTTVSGIVNVTAQLKARGVYDLIVHDSVSGELLGWLSGVVYLPVANSDTIRSFSEVMRPVTGTGAGGSLCEVPKKTGYLLIVSDQSSSLSDGLTRILGSRVVDHVSLGAWPDRVTGESELLFILQAPESASGIKVWRTDCLHPLIEAMKSCDTDTALNLQF